MVALATLVRAAALACASVACAFTAATAALVTHQLSLPASDGAYGQPLHAVWSDPFVRMAAFPLAVGGALLGFVAALAWLWRTRLALSIPIVFGGTVLAAAVAGPLHVLAALPTLIYAVWTMHWCRRRFPAVRGG